MVCDRDDNNYTVWSTSIPMGPKVPSKYSPSFHSCSLCCIILCIRVQILAKTLICMSLRCTSQTMCTHANANCVVHCVVFLERVHRALPEGRHSPVQRGGNKRLRQAGGAGPEHVAPGT